MVGGWHLPFEVCLHDELICVVGKQTSLRTGQTSRLAASDSTLWAASGDPGAATPSTTCGTGMARSSTF
jgi:hypothetical protein